MCKIAVSLLEMDYSRLGDQLFNVYEAGLDIVHIDMMDGVFVPSLGIGTKLIEGIRSGSRLKFDVHLMVVEPERFTERLAKAGADRIIVHYEACKDPEAVLSGIRRAGCMAGLALKPDTSLEVLDRELLKKSDIIHLMTTVPGVEGQSFMPVSYQRIVSVREKLDVLGLSRQIEVDGGINMDNLEGVVKAGADVIVAGRAIARGDMAENIKNMRTIIQRTGRQKDLRFA